jgi:phosphate transport system permease protein
MTDATASSRPLAADARSAHTRRRYAAERRFRAYGVAAISIAVAAVVLLLSSVLVRGLPAFTQTYVKADIFLDPAVVDPTGSRDPADLSKVLTFAYAALIKNSLNELATELQAGPAPGITPQLLAGMVSESAGAQLRNFVLANPDEIGETVAFEFLASGRIDQFVKGNVTRESAAGDARLDPAQLDAADRLAEIGVLDRRFNLAFLTSPDASENRPEAAGLGVALLGSAYMMLIVLTLSLPIGVAASIYLEEFAPKNRWTDLIEVNISNLAAVPSIVYGILGLAFFINFAHLPRSAPIVGGLVLTLMTLPTIIISTRAAIKSVPPSIREAALGVGASRMQAMFHHILPLAAPGILTGTIIGMAHALGETAPLLLIGMVAFVREFPGPLPGGLMDPATALPVQVYNFTQRADPAFVERAAGAIVVLLVFLLIMNAIAVFLRQRLERTW